MDIIAQCFLTTGTFLLAVYNFGLTEVQRKFRDSVFELKQKVDFNQKLDGIFVYKRVVT
jgi:hypothetical protein